MTRIEKVMAERQEEIKKVLVSHYCPFSFGIGDIPETCTMRTPETFDSRSCLDCWNEEIKE